MAADINLLDPDLRQACIELQQACSDAGILPTITSTLRSTREQTFLYNRYVQGLSRLPAAPPGQSAHEYGWAFDMIVSPRSAQTEVGQAWGRLWGGTWGGARDPVHFELPGASVAARSAGAGLASPDDSQSQSQPSASTPAGPTLWDYVQWGLIPLGGLIDILIELGYAAVSPNEARKLAQALHVSDLTGLPLGDPPEGRVHSGRRRWMR